MEKLEQFINAIRESRKVWLLQAREGFFAMLEDNDGNSYIPLWATEESASKAAQGDWEGYTVSDMGFSELKHWLKELASDEIDIAVAPEQDGEIMALSSAVPVESLRKGSCLPSSWALATGPTYGTDTSTSLG